VAGGAALTFDPRSPHELFSALARVLQDPDLERELGAAGLRRARELDGADGWARRYLDLMRRVIHGAGPVREGLAGLYEDGWSGRRMTLAVCGDHARRADLHIANPRPSEVELVVGDERLVVPGGRELRLHGHVAPGTGLVHLQVDPLFSPSRVWGSDDHRELGVRVLDLAIEPASGATDG
jgi:hypothetical protein